MGGTPMPRYATSEASMTEIRSLSPVIRIDPDYFIEQFPSVTREQAATVLERASERL